MWAIIPLLGLVVYHVVTDEEVLGTLRSRVAIVVALAVEVALTFALPPRFGAEVTWPLLRWVSLAVGTVVATLVTASIMRRRDENHLFAVFFLFTIVNSLLQMALYLLF
ncbi:MAG: hypothetical protein ISS49_15320 [Anaerolineae bacterium]|nr:hypothetical protein [Anaerolineae bacterium]